MTLLCYGLSLCVVTSTFTAGLILYLSNAVHYFSAYLKLVIKARISMKVRICLKRDGGRSPLTRRIKLKPDDDMIVDSVIEIQRCSGADELPLTVKR